MCVDIIADASDDAAMCGAIVSALITGGKLSYPLAVTLIKHTAGTSALFEILFEKIINTTSSAIPDSVFKVLCDTSLYQQPACHKHRDAFL